MAFTLVAALWIAAAARAHGCYIESASGKLAGSPPLEQAADALSLDQTVASLVYGYGSWSGQWVDNTKVTYACVDSRGVLERPNDALETPGGDFAELLGAIAAYHSVKGTPATEASVDAIFKRFMSSVATISRPFHFHTARTYLEKAFEKFANLTGQQPPPVVLPAVAPGDTKLVDAWLAALSDTSVQGCGHVRKIMEHPDQFGLQDASMPKWLIKSFFRFFWTTPLDSYQRRLVSFPILLGPLDGRSLAIITNAGPGCANLTPAAVPSHGGSALFLYNAAAVKAFRSAVLGPLIKGYDSSVDEGAVVAAIEKLQGQQLAATLRLLDPVNKLPLYAVDLTVKE